MKLKMFEEKVINALCHIGLFYMTEHHKLISGCYWSVPLYYLLFNSCII